MLAMRPPDAHAIVAVLPSATPSIHWGELPRMLQEVALGGEVEPCGQDVQVALLVAPVVALKVPGGQAVRLREAKGQKAPAGQRMGAPEEQ